jgi:hypothetical protein
LSGVSNQASPISKSFEYWIFPSSASSGETVQLNHAVEKSAHYNLALVVPSIKILGIRFLYAFMPPVGLRKNALRKFQVRP